ncbi:hypothetical protein [Pseudalkalibacillus salsuginis]|uniref:hypothetical protein n=1 Tax=Pseudalkalibacillus salsuginis TaxID=2910972 RepID=UPI001F3CBD07|nr:hypothetical protein [Pseudalkalibacillus salsuginis]MCF6411057.1 hypothetical protein [Pseudalkalibacillus salsuginis]
MCTRHHLKILGGEGLWFGAWHHLKTLGGEGLWFGAWHHLKTLGGEGLWFGAWHHLKILGGEGLWFGAWYTQCGTQSMWYTINVVHNQCGSYPTKASPFCIGEAFV